MAERTDVGTVEDLHASASKLVGLDDFGADDDNYREALAVLLDSYQREADLTPLGSKMSRFFLRGALVARLLSEAAWKQYPAHADVVIERPIFVTGLVRTGTTALHRLLGADPAHQGLQMWLAEYPQPRPPRDTWESNPVYRQLDAQFTQHHNENPGYTGLHFMAADELEECWQLLRQSFHSVHRLQTRRQVALPVSSGGFTDRRGTLRVVGEIRCLRMRFAGGAASSAGPLVMATLQQHRSGQPIDVGNCPIVGRTHAC